MRSLGKPLLRAFLCIGVVVAISEALLKLQAKAMVAGFMLLIVVLLVSAAWGLAYAVLVSVSAAFALSWFMPPYSSFTISDPRDWIGLLTFLTTGLVAGHLADRARWETANANQRRNEAVLAQQRFADLVNSVEGIVWEADPETLQFSFVSKQAERVLGYPVERWLSEPNFWKNHLHPEDRDSAPDHCSQALIEKRSRDCEFRMIAADGQVVWLRDIASLAFEGGRATRLRGVMVDITARRRAEYLTRHVFESSPDSVGIIGRDYRYKQVNPRFETTWGVPSEEIVGMEVRELIGGDAFERVKPHLDRCLGGEEVQFGDWVDTPGGRRYRAISFSPLRPETDEVQAVLVVSRDVTEQISAWEALRQAQLELARISRVTTVGELTASLAHEINQPISAALTNANTAIRWLDRNPPNVQEAREAASRMQRSVTRASEIIKGVRSLFRNDARQREWVDLNEVIREMVPLVHSESSQYRISISTELDPALPRVMADRIQLQQVVMNLTLNGIEAMREVNGTRELTIKSAQDGADQLEVSVSDTGVGLPSGQVDQIFKAFFTTKPQGTGMGLAISKSIIESHGGRLWAAANAGSGTTFHFTLPQPS